MIGGFVFPGQGSQSIGMLKDLAASYPAVRATFSEASEALGYDLWRWSRKARPALLAAGVSVWRLWTAKGGARPAWVAGHSLGEYTALVRSGLTFVTDTPKDLETGLGEMR